VYPIVERVREKKLLTSTAESGVLSALEDAGSLGNRRPVCPLQAEKLLPLVEEAGLLSFAAKNADFLLNTVGFLAVEPAELALPAVTGAIRVRAGRHNLPLSFVTDSFVYIRFIVVLAAPLRQVTAAKATAAPKAAARPVMKAPPRAAGPSISAVPKAAISAAKSAPVLKAAPKPVMKAAPKPAPKPVVKAAPKPAPKVENELYFVVEVF
ncbi:unnamed protein product, partial [Phaeothamnion confervicola]